MSKILTEKIINKEVKVVIIGLGYVGVPLILAVANAGFEVIGVDINKDRVNTLNSGKSFIADIFDEEIKKILSNFHATNNWQEISKCQVIIITVPTPLTKNKIPDTTAIEKSAQNIAQHLQKNSLVILESTTYPGTTEELLQPILETSGLKAGRDFYLAFAPERIDPGNKKYKLADIPKIVGGINLKSTEIAAKFYQTFINQIHKVSSPKTAELAKLLENIFRLVNISLVNELNMLSDKLKIDFREVIEAAKTKPYGFMPFYPGPGAGGHCIPLDPFYLSWKAREVNFFTRFIDLAGEINELMPHYVVTKIFWALNKKKKSIHGSKILIIGVAYKKDIDDERESPATHIIWDLLRKGGKIIYHDPYIPKIQINGHTLFSKPLTSNLLKNVDCVVILTDHSNIDYKNIVKNSKLVIDTRNAIGRKYKNVVIF